MMQGILQPHVWQRSWLFLVRVQLISVETSQKAACWRTGRADRVISKWVALLEANRMTGNLLSVERDTDYCHTDITVLPQGILGSGQEAVVHQMAADLHH